VIRGPRGAAPARTRPWSRAVGLLLAGLLLVLVGCRGGEDPSTRLREATEATLGTEVAFELRAEADRAALEQLGDAAGDAAQFLADFRVVGTRVPDGPTSLAVELTAGQPVLEAVVLPDGELRLRTGLGAMLGMDETAPAEALDPELERRGVSPEQRRALLAGFEGGWIAVPDAGGIEGALGRGGAEDEAEGPGLERLMAAVEVTDASDDGGRERIEVLVDVARLLDPDADAGVGERVPAVVEIEDGLVRRIRIELGDELDGVDEGRVRLELLLDDHGAAESGEVPEVEATVTLEELEELLALLGG
jgi:hypothetical protein